MSCLVAAGEIGRALGLTHALRLPPPRGRWSWRPDDGVLLPPDRAGASAFDLARFRADLAALPEAAVLVGPTDEDDGALVREVIGMLLEAGHGVAVVGGEPGPGALRIDLADAFPDTGAAGPALRPIFPGAPDGTEEDRYVPLRTSAEDGRRLVRWAEQSGRPGVDALLGAVFHGGDPHAGAPSRWPVPLPFPKRFPSFAQATGSLLRSDGWRLSALGEEVAAQELFASARRIEALGERFERYVETGLLRQLPGIDPRAFSIVEESL